MIIATAGHVDHGKTSLVKALTGVDTDRLKEEKLRGMSIEPGFAYAELGTGYPIGFVDVPGHERFVRNMLAGVSAVDFVLLVIAADDGPMPQTIEHLAILELLGVRQGAVALTKIDRVSAARLADAQVEVASALEKSALRDARVFPVAAHRGTGMADLQRHLAAVARAMPSRHAHGHFRLAVDRSFLLDGAGLIVTGAVSSGSVRVGDQLLVSPQGIPVRVRGIHVHDRAAEAAQAGCRCALNLAGADLKRSGIARGDWVVAPPAHAPTLRFDARVTVLASQSKPLGHWMPAHLHCGAATVNARVALLEGYSIEPGRTALTQLVTDRPVAIVRGDRFVLRDHAAQRVIAGGTVLDPFAPARGRSKPARLACLAALEEASPADGLRRLLDARTDGVSIDGFARTWNLTDDEAGALLLQVPVVRFRDNGDARGVSVSRWETMRRQLGDCLAEWHRAHPDGVGPSEEMLAARLGMRLLPPAWRSALKSLCEEGQVVREGVSLRLAQHRPQLSEQDAALLERVREVLRSAGPRPPVVGELSKALSMEQPALVDFLERADRLGHLVRVAKNRFFLPEKMSELAGIASALSRESEDGVFDAAAYRDRSGVGRNVTIEVLEFMDRMRMTRYVRGRRRAL